MTALHSIVAATDFSAPARQAADRAARLAHETGARLTLVHALPQQPLAELRQWLGEHPAAEQRLRQQARQELDTMAAALAAGRRATVQARLAAGPVLDEIERAAVAEQADLLVVGARGHGFMRRLVLGTTAERMLRRSRRPLLVVRQPPHEPYRRALVALDFSPWSAAALALARSVAPHARPVLLTAFQVPFEDKLHFAGVDAGTIDAWRRRARAQATQDLHALAQSAGLKPGAWDACIVEGDASQRIVEQEQEQARDREHCSPDGEHHADRSRCALQRLHGIRFGGHAAQR